jgi:hypothetical protein
MKVASAPKQQLLTVVASAFSGPSIMDNLIKHSPEKESALLNLTQLAT